MAILNGGCPMETEAQVKAAPRSCPLFRNARGLEGRALWLPSRPLGTGHCAWTVFTKMFSAVPLWVMYELLL